MKLISYFTGYDSRWESIVIKWAPDENLRGCFTIVGKPNNFISSYLVYISMKISFLTVGIIYVELGAAKLLTQIILKIKKIT